MKIHFYINTSFPYGMAAAKRRLCYAKGLMAAGHQVDVVVCQRCFEPGDDDGLPDNGIFRNIPYIYVRGKYKYSKANKLLRGLDYYVFDYVIRSNMTKFINYLKENVVNEGGKADLWDTDVNFAAGLKDAPAKEDIKIGKVFSSVKKKEAVNAVLVNPGVEFEGPAGTPQIADKDGAYLVKDGSGIRMVQKAEFLKAYSITKVPATNGRQFVRE